MNDILSNLPDTPEEYARERIAGMDEEERRTCRWLSESELIDMLTDEYYNLMDSDPHYQIMENAEIEFVAAGKPKSRIH